MKTMTLKEARESQGLTIEGLAKKADISFSTLQAIESGRLKGSLIAKIKIADVLDFPIGVIFPDLIEEINELLVFQKKDQKRMRILSTHDLDNSGRLTPEAKKKRLLDLDKDD